MKKQIERGLKAPDQFVEAIVEKFLYVARNNVHSRIYKWKTRPYEGSLPFLDANRESYVSLLHFLTEHALANLYDPDKGYFRLPLSYNYTFNRKRCDLYESIARTFIGATYLLKDRAEPDIAGPYLECIRKGTDPRSRYYWGKINHQRTVENGSLAVGMLLNKEYLWPSFSGSEQANIIDFVRETAKMETYPTNWMWFRLFQYLFLEQFEQVSYSDQIRGLFAKISSLYKGDGWYNDDGTNINTLFDEYNGCTYHYYGPLFCLLAGSEYDDIKPIIKERLDLFCRNHLKLFSSERLPIFWGRSMSHRFANLASFGMGLRLGVISEQDYPVVKRKVTGTINAFLRHGCIDYRGLLSPAYTQPVPGMLEPYCGLGSSYWTLKAFCILLLEKEHPFWQIPLTKPEVEDGRLNETVIESIPIYLQTNDRNEGFMLNGGANTKKWDRRKYNAFAYSNQFPFVLDWTYIPNAFSFLYKGKPEIKDTLLQVQTKPGPVFTVEWTVYNIPEFKGFTTMVPLAGGYCLLHNIETPIDIPYLYSGFAVPFTQEYSIQKTVSNIILSNQEYHCTLHLISDNEVEYGSKSMPVSKCVICCKTQIPWARSILKKGSNRIIISAQAGFADKISQARIEEDEDVIIIEDSFKGNRIFKLDQDNRYFSIV